MKKNTGLTFRCFRLKILLPFFFMILTLQSFTSAQERKLVYDVVKGGKIIGKITFEESNRDRRKFLSFNSDIKTNFLFSFNDHTIETSIFENDILVYTSLFQKQTGSGKTNSILQANGNTYRLHQGNNVGTMNQYPIYFNTLLLYVKPPENTYKIYSQKFQRLLSVEKIKDNEFKLLLPDGNYNYYKYKNGLCIEVVIERALFNVIFVLKEIQE